MTLESGKTKRFAPSRVGVPSYTHRHEVGKEVTMVRVSGAEDLHHTGQSGFSAGTHIQGFGGQPQSVNSDHRSSSRSHSAQSVLADVGQATLMEAGPRLISTLIVAGVDDDSVLTGMKPVTI